MGYAYNYVYNYTDHLGNIRVSYSKDPRTNQLKILEENHYYPFGLKHSVYSAGRLRDFEVDSSNPEGEHVFLNNVTKTEYHYKYNGQEWQDELGLNMYAMDMRQYDPAIGRWVAQDPVTHFDYSPYSAFDNNPVFWADPSGADAVDIGYDRIVDSQDLMGSVHWSGGFQEIENEGGDDWFLNSTTGDIIHAPNETKGYEKKLGKDWEHLAEENELKPLPSEDGQEVSYTETGLRDFLELNNLKLAPTEILRDYTFRNLMNNNANGMSINVTQENIVEVWLRLTYVKTSSVRVSETIQVLETKDRLNGYNSIQRVQTKYSNSFINKILVGMRDVNGIGSTNSGGSSYQSYVGWNNYPSDGSLLKFK
jgi:RHS repeat-associated protein